MKKLALIVVAGAFLGGIGAANAQATCKTNATDKKLAGAAMNSFMKKCQTDAQKSCDAQAKDKKLNGAAKTSFTKKCVNDAVGS